MYFWLVIKVIKVGSGFKIKTMNYLCQNKTPVAVLLEAGFEKAPDRGYQIVIRQGRAKHPPNEYDIRTLIPNSRWHAFVRDNWIELHIDSGRRKKLHKSYSHSKEVIDKVEEFKKIDTNL